MGFVSNIDHAAHFGGFLAGLLCGGLMMNWLEVIDLESVKCSSAFNKSFKRTKNSWLLLLRRLF